MSLFRSHFFLLPMYLELLAFVMFLSEFLLFPAHFFVVLFLKLKLVLDVLDIAVDGFECFQFLLGLLIG